MSREECGPAHLPAPGQTRAVPPVPVCGVGVTSPDKATKGGLGMGSDGRVRSCQANAGVRRGVVRKQEHEQMNGSRKCLELNVLFFTSQWRKNNLFKEYLQFLKIQFLLLMEA